MKMLRLEEHVLPRAIPRDPLLDCRMMGLLPPAPGPKDTLRRYLKEHKSNAGKPSVSEKELVDAIDKLGAKHDKETEDILYALSDLCPHESVKRKAIEALRK